MIGLGSIFDFLWLVLGWTKLGQRTGTLAVIDHAGPIAAETVVWPPELVAPEVLGQFFGHIMSAIVHLYASFSLFKNVFLNLLLIIPNKCYRDIMW